MGRIWTTRSELLEQLGEIVLYKSGLLLSEAEILGHAAHDELLQGDHAEGVTFRAEEYEALVVRVLHAVGNIDAPSESHPGIFLVQKYLRDPEKTAIVEMLMESLGACTMARQEGQPVDITPMFIAAKERFGIEGLELAHEFHDLLLAHLHGSPWSRMRRVEWQNDAALVDLFQSAELATPHGTFFDQRYIDYLASQFDAIDRIHWRKFEGLTCEYFERMGCRVEIGPGSNDDNVDARVWWPDEPAGAPATLLVQCKREQQTIGKLVVKALYADIQWEGAKGGLVVTTQRLASGAEAVRLARAYPIDQADRRALRRWLHEMRSTR